MNTLYKNRWTFAIEWSVLFLLSIFIHIIYFSGPHFILDGDEAMVGFMAADFISFKNLPIYFYGQQYGLSFFEEFFGSIFVVLLGKSTLSLKLGALLLFTLGIQRLLKLSRSSNPTILLYILVGLLLLAYPPWLIWGTKLRGGYLTAFVCFSFSIELLNRKHLSLPKVVVLALLTAIGSFAQPMFVAVYAPVLIIWLLINLRHKKRRHFIMFFASLFPISLAINIIRLQNLNTWNPSTRVFNQSALQSLLANDFFSIFSVFFRYENVIEAPPAVLIAAKVFFVLTILLGGLLTVYYRDKINVKLMGLIIGTLISLFFFGYAGGGAGRYLLPFFSGLLVMVLFIVMTLQSLSPRFVLPYVICILALFAPATIFSNEVDNILPLNTVSDSQSLDVLKHEIVRGNYTYSYSTFWELTWQLNYSFYDKKFFRDLYLPGRIPDKYRLVDDCHYSPECKTVLCGRIWELEKVDDKKLEGIQPNIIAKRYFIIQNPSTALLHEFGFQLNKPKD